MEVSVFDKQPIILLVNADSILHNDWSTLLVRYNTIKVLDDAFAIASQSQ
jgi:hypothetical protein